MPGSFDDEDRKANNNSDWGSDDDDNDESDENTESEEDEDDEDRFDDDDEDEGNDDDEDDDEQNLDEDDDEEDEEEEEDDNSNDDEEDDSLPDEETGLRYQDDDDDDDELGAAAMEQNPYQDEPIGEDKEKSREATKNTLIACFLCCICLVLLVSAVVLGVVFSKGSNTVESSTLPPIPTAAPSATPKALTNSPGQRLPTLAPLPTKAPTVSPAPTNATTEFPSFFPTLAPSMSPTISLEPTASVRTEQIIYPDEDTFIYLGGFTPGDAQGKEQTLLVQNGPNGDNEVPDAYALLLFSLEDLPQPWRITDRQPQAILRLTQVIRPDAAELAPSNLTVVRLPPTPLAVETLTGMMFAPYDGIPGPSFIVNSTQRHIEVDVTSLIFDQPPFVPGRRQLQGKGSQFFIMIENQGADQPIGGNRFASRESSDKPQLFIGLFKPGAPRPTLSPTPSPTTSSQPSVSAVPTSVNTTTQPTSVSSSGSFGPTAISPVATKAPTISNQTAPQSVPPSRAPTVSNQTAPQSVPPTKAPTISNQTAPPTASPTKNTIPI